MSENTITPDTSVLNNLRNIPEDSLRALTLDEFKKFTFEHLLRLQEARDKEVERYNNPVRFLLSEFNAPSVYGNEIGKLQHESAQKIKELNKQIQEYGMNREIAISNYSDSLQRNSPVSLRKEEDIEAGNVDITGFSDQLLNSGEWETE